MKNFTDLVNLEYNRIQSKLSSHDQHLEKQRLIGEGKHDQKFINEVNAEYDRIQNKINAYWLSKRK